MLQTLAGGSALAPLAAIADTGSAAFQPTWESLKQFRCPAWFPDAKFGIWAHWGPQCVPKQGDWYARNMYIEGHAQYKYHVAHYGHPSRFGYKDIIPLWKAENWEPETLIRRYKKAGARYFVALGCHCDNFDCWNSRNHRWNAVNFGPKKDIVGIWRQTARNHGLRFGVTEHMAWSYSWFNTNKGADKTGPYAGVPYDGNDPKYQDLYFEPHEEHAASYPQHPSESWRQAWFRRVKDLVDQHQPDLVYTDGAVFGDVGREQIAHFYNANISWHGGRQEGVYTLKNPKDHGQRIGEFEPGISLLDIERGVVDDIRPEPWQTDTCLGNWYYKEGIRYKTAQEVIHMLVDIVSKNGNLLLNFPLLPDGTLDAEEEKVLEGITGWFAVNGETIYGTRPWKIYGEGPTKAPSGSFGEKGAKPFTASDFRFATRGNSLFVYAMGWPEGDLRVQSLGRAAGLWDKNIARIVLAGSEEKIHYTRETDALVIRRPKHRPGDYASVFRIDAV
jgi:alpha-L-fucosidase